MPQRIETAPLAGNRTLHDVRSAISRANLEAAMARRMRKNMASLIRRSHNLFHAADLRLAELWETLKDKHREGVDLGDVMRYLWSTFEADVRFLCDHVMEDDPIDKEAMAHAAGSALIGLRSILMACLRNEDPPFDPQAMMEYIEQMGDGNPSDCNRIILSSDKAWGDAVSNHG